MPRTPPLGIGALQKQMTDHDAKDDKRFDALGTDVKELLKLTGQQNAVLTGQNVALEFIRQSLSKRARTEEAEQGAELEVRTEKRKAWWKGLLGLLFAAAAGGGALVHYLVS